MSADETQVAVKGTHGKGQAARNAAIKRLIEEYPDRWAELHAEERKARGLFPVMKKEKKLTKTELEEQNAKLRAALLAQGVNPDEV